MQYKVDSYTLEHIENNGKDKYFIAFKDSVNKGCRIEIDEDIFNVYMESKKAYVKIKNEKDRHIEPRNLTEEEICKKAFNTIETVEKTVMKKMEKEKLNEVLENLTEIQLRRLQLHWFNEMTIRDIAKLEKVRKNQIEKSIKSAIKKLKKNFDW